MYTLGFTKKRFLSAILLLSILGIGLTFGLLPNLDTIDKSHGDTGTICFQGTCFNVADVPAMDWWEVSRTHFQLAGVGVLLAILAAGATRVFLSTFVGTSASGKPNNLKDYLRHTILLPTGSAFAHTGRLDGPYSMAIRSFGLNIPVLVAVALIFVPVLGLTRTVVGIIASLLVGGIVLRIVNKHTIPQDVLVRSDSQDEMVAWKSVYLEVLMDWFRASLGYLIRIGIPMAIAAVLAGISFGTSLPDTVSSYLGNHLLGVFLAATVGLFITLPFLIEIPLVAFFLAVGMGVAPGSTLLFAAAIGGPVSFREIGKGLSSWSIGLLVLSIWIISVAGGFGILALSGGKSLGDVDPATLGSNSESDDSFPNVKFPTLVNSQSKPGNMLSSVLMDQRDSNIDLETVVPFENVAERALGDKASLDNPLPGLAIFDYDRDGLLDLYLTQKGGLPNYLFHNDGNGIYRESGEEAGVVALQNNSTGVAACDINNDGFQDLYIGAETDREDSTYQRSTTFLESSADRLYLNNRDGTFKDISSSAFEAGGNYSRASSVVCADVDNDGWIDIFVGNRSDVWGPNRDSFRNVLFRNNGDLTFTNVASRAGIEGHEQIQVRDEVIQNEPVTWAALFFDYDDDGDPDLWVANDADRLRVYRNDSNRERIKFTPVERAMGIDTIGNWMGFAPADYDGDGDLDIFVTNIGFHPKTRPAPKQRSGDCAWAQQFEIGTCEHFLLRNDGLLDMIGMGTIGVFSNVAGSTVVQPSRSFPPASLDHLNILPLWQPPTGLAAYDFGFGTVFFDYDNDGDPDLYWLGSLFERGEGGENGMQYPAAGRMLANIGNGNFQDITVEAGLLGIRNVDYSVLDPSNPIFNAEDQRISVKFHENGKGLAKGDLNGDGYVDLVATNASGNLIKNGKTSHENGPTFMWINPGGGRNWITLRLKGRMAVDGTGSNADGIGARVFLRAKVNGNDTKLLVDTVSISSFLSMSSLDLYFGLGKAESVEEITIFWPSGVRQVLKNISVNQLMEIEESRE